MGEFVHMRTSAPSSGTVSHNPQKSSPRLYTSIWMIGAVHGSVRRSHCGCDEEHSCAAAQKLPPASTGGYA